MIRSLWYMYPHDSSVGRFLLLLPWKGKGILCSCTFILAFGKKEAKMMKHRRESTPVSIAFSHSTFWGKGVSTQISPFLYGQIFHNRYILNINNNFPRWNLANIQSEWKKVQLSCIPNRIAHNPHSSNRWLQLFISFSVFTAFLELWDGPRQSRSQRPRSFAHAHEYLVSKQRWGWWENVRALYFIFLWKVRGYPN